MKVLVTGVKGQLGFDVVNELEKRGHTAIGVDVDTMDITNSEQVENVIKANMPEAVIHCAAYTAVDLAEDNKELCDKINGEGERPWQPDDTVTIPLNEYGYSKYLGEQAVQKYVKDFYIVRIAWVFGINGKNFVKTMLNVGKNHDTVRVVNDQIGTPTYTFDLARLLVDMIETDKYGVYHGTNEGGYISWYDFTCEIYRQAGYTTNVVPVTTEEYGLSKAKRPKNSRLDKSKLVDNGFKTLPDWKDALARYIEILNKEN